ncbi:MAG TPA: lysylphosphatidylglycerol synthase transmembrane domain-containing protein [Dongiaceae bacterium]|nr:lysylphosphatidylglycerol synthase transmembrane domain-containing protein [Dongiaceae bacterium]
MTGLAIRPDLRRKAAQLPWLHIARWFTGVICVGAVIAVVLNIADIERLLAIIRGIEPLWLLLALVTQAMTYAAAAGIWLQVLHANGSPVPFHVLYRLSLAQLFAEQALPSSGVSGALLVVKGLVNRGIEEATGMGCMLVGMISYYAGYLLAILASFIILFSEHDRHDPHMMVLVLPLLVVAGFFCLLIVAVLGLVFWLRRRGGLAQLPTRWQSWLQRWRTGWSMLERLVQMLGEAPAALLRNRSLLSRATALQITVFLIDAVTFTIMLQAIGTHLRYDIVFACFVLASLVGSVLPVPLGLGSFEASCVALLHLFLVPVETGLVAVLLLRGFTFWLPMLPGLWLAHRELRALQPRGEDIDQHLEERISS